MSALEIVRSRAAPSYYAYGILLFLDQPRSSDATISGDFAFVFSQTSMLENVRACDANARIGMLGRPIPK